MTKIEFSKDETKLLTDKIQCYFKDELDQKLGQFEAGFLLDFISEELGAYYYNKGLHDAQAILSTRLDSITEAIYEIEQVTNSNKI